MCNTKILKSLPPWGAMLQATVEFCKQNVEGTTIVAMFAKQTCKFVLQNTNYVDLRCSKFIQHKRRAPHPSLAKARATFPTGEGLRRKRFSGSTAATNRGLRSKYGVLRRNRFVDKFVYELSNQSLSRNFLSLALRKSSVSPLTSPDIKKSAVRFMSVIAPTAKSVVCQIASEETKAPRNAEAQ